MTYNPAKWLKFVGLLFLVITILSFVFSIPFFEISLAANKKGYFTIENINGIGISEVAKNSPADLAGLQVGDIITKANNITINSISDYTSLAYNNKQYSYL